MAGSLKHVGGVLLLLVLSARGASPETEIAPRPVLGAGGSIDSFVLELTTPEPTLVPGADGFRVISIEGFDARQRRVGVPDVPTRVVLVAVPPDAEPTLEIRRGSESLRRNVRPAPVPRVTVEVSPDERVQLERATKDPSPQVGILQRSASKRHDPDPAFYGGDKTFPRREAWLGRTGFLRDQRYIEVHLAPVRYDPAIDGLRVLQSMEIVVHFNRASRETLVPASADPHFEQLYRGAFVNYEQSRHFRSSANVGAGDEPNRMSSVATTSAANSTPRQRIGVRENGWIRLDESMLQPTGFLAHAISTWKLTNRGVSVPLETNDDGDGTLEPGEWVQFYGQALDDEPKTVLNYDFVLGSDDLYEVTDFSDENVYFLSVDAQAQPPMQERDAAPTLTRTPPDFFRAVRHEEVDDGYRPLGGADPWYWLPSLLLSSTVSRVDSVTLPGLYAGTEPATVRMHIRGLDEDEDVNPDHLTRLTVENNSQQTLLVDNGMFDARSLYLHEIDWTWTGGAQLSETLDFTLEVLESGAVCFGVSCNSVIADYIEVEYSRAFSAIDDLLVFEWPDGDAEFVVSGLQDTSPGVYEITLASGEKVTQPVRLLDATVSGTGPFSVRFRVDEEPGIVDGTPRRFIVAGQGAVRSLAPADFVPDSVSDLRDNALQADYIVLAHPDVLDDGPASPLSLLLAHRATPGGGNLTSKIVMLEDVEDEFNYGLSGPPAIKEFVRWIISDQPGEGWADPKPAYLMLLGDASLDYKGGVSQGNLVPTQMLFLDNPILGYYASDNVMVAAVGDDQLADIIVGRIPARSVTDANRMLQKVLDYETATPTGSWRQNVLLISDRGKGARIASEAVEFETLNENSEAKMQIPPFTSRHLRYYPDYFLTPDPTPWDTINADIKATINGTDGLADGAVIVQFVGHGNFVIWSNDVFFDERLALPQDPFQDSMDLTNSGRLPWLMAHNCLTGGFHVIDHNSMAENWLKLDGGGAVGSFAPTGLSFNFVSDHVVHSVWGELFGPTKQRVVGQVVLSTLVRLCTQGTIEACQYYALQGDPATHLALREVEPATSLSAVGSNARIDLSWTASPTPGAVYDVYRTFDDPLLNNYFKIAEDVSGTSYADTGLINAHTYTYFILAQDSEGFESRQSNFNFDCGGAGPDCVQATPLNPDPPLPPTDLQIHDPGLGHVLELSWAANTEDDLASYTVRWGTESGSYSNVLTVGDQTRLTLLNLVEGQIYYFVVRATNTSTKTSAPSNEASDFPTAALGLRSPSYVEDLQVTRNGDDLVLDWGEVTTDIVGKSETVAHYEIFRGAAPDYDGNSLVKIGECPSPCSSFTDTAAVLIAGGLEYRVRAVDTDLNTGGMGSEPPRAVDLALEKSASTPGDIVLTWPAVTDTVDGSPVDLEHYAIYVSDQPFTRADIRDSAVGVLTTVTTTSFELTPAAQSRYYSVLAVDRRGNTSPF